MWIGYTEDKGKTREVCLDPMESDAAMERYIDRRRSEFYEEWFQYLDENGQQEFFFF